MKDFTKKGTKLPVIPVGTKFKWLEKGEFKEPCKGNKKGTNSEKSDFISFGIYRNDNKIYVICDSEKDSYCKMRYLIKLSTIERLAKEQGMCNTNNENMKVTLQENGTVTVTDTETTTTLSKATVDEICRLVKDKDKQPIKPVITYGGWYQNKSNPKIVVFYEKDDAVFGGVGYGFDAFGGFTHANNWSLKSFKEDWQPATHKTVEQYLKAEAVKREFVKGTKYKHIKFDTVEVLKKPENLKLNLDYNNLTDGCGGSIFDKGVWATIIEEETKDMTVKQIEEKLGHKIKIIK